MKYRKKPVEIEAFQYDGDMIYSDGTPYAPSWALQALESGTMYYEGQAELYIKTLEGNHHVSVGDYIIKSVSGELYPCKPDIFEKPMRPWNKCRVTRSGPLRSAALPEELAELFRGLELTLLQEICSRLKIADQLNEVTVQDVRALRAQGIDLDDIKQAIAETTEISMDKLNTLLDDVVARNQKYYAEMVDLAQVTVPERFVDERDIEAIRRQTVDEFTNITQSMGFVLRQGGRKILLPPAKAYQWALDSAELQIMSGAISYNQAVESAVRQLAESGIKTVSYESGHVDSVDVACRRAVMTGVNQLNQKYRERSMDYLGTDLVEVTAHSGARDVDGPMGWENHKAWQGKVYRWRRSGTGRGISAHRSTIPQSSTVPAPVQHPESKSNQLASVPRANLTLVDVTEEYLDAATPGEGTVSHEDGYKIKGHRTEIEMADWIHRTFGGDIKLLKESNEKNQETPDFIWNPKMWELKGATSINGADKLLQHAIKQIRNNPGGVVMNILEDVDMSKLEAQLTRRFLRSNIVALDLMLLSKGKLVKVLRYKK